MKNNQFVLPTSEQLLRHQIEHYTQLLKNSKTVEQKAHRRLELYRFKQLLQSKLN